MVQAPESRKKGGRQSEQVDALVHDMQLMWMLEHSRQAPPLRYRPCWQLVQAEGEVHEGQGHSAQLLEELRKNPKEHERQEVLEEQEIQGLMQGWQVEPSI